MSKEPEMKVILRRTGIFEGRVDAIEELYQAGARVFRMNHIGHGRPRSFIGATSVERRFLRHCRERHLRNSLAEGSSGLLVCPKRLLSKESAMPMYELTESETIQFLEQQRIARLGLDAASERYMIALGYHYAGGSLYFVTTEGRKTEMLRKNPQASFQVDDSAVTGPFGWTSVVGQGHVEFVTDAEEIGAISPDLFGKFDDMPEWAAKEYEEKGQSGQLVFLRLRPDSMSARRSGP